MALFGKKEKTVVAPVAEKKVTVARVPRDGTVAVIGPRITEKATDSAARNVYVFNVRVDANKKTIAHAIKELYKVSPERVSIVTIRAKTVFRRGKLGTTNTGKKAYVYLKEGDKIEFV
ncbi:MAG: 50S ribosomal protein L23 [Candidatus Paceibacterota bacterium]|jgi:large subunit ribosomal protein L23